MIDGASINSKLARVFLKELSEKNQGKLTPISELKLETIFSRDGQRLFVLICITHMMKNMRNAFPRKGKDFCYPKLTLLTCFVLEDGVCSVK